MSVELKDVEEWEGEYAISSDGRVWSYPKARRSYGRWLKSSINHQGYARVNFYRNKKCYTQLVHTLVLEAFVGPSEGREANHRDFNRSNNTKENLEWMTHEENVAYSWDNNAPDRKGESNGRHFLTEEDVKKIRDVRKSTRASYINIARRFGLLKGHVADICIGRIWQHV